MCGMYVHTYGVCVYYSLVFLLIPVNFTHFKVLRAIGKGSFGKVSRDLQ